MTYPECVDYLFNLHRFGIRLGLETMELLCAELGNPQESLKFVHIAGTNGKGSTAAFLESVLREEGYLTGLYTSPHLVEMGERIRVGGEMIPREQVVRLTLKIRAVIQANPALENVSFFEFLTAMALLHFEEKNVEIVVWETGLGGRLDATNIVDPLCCVITRIGYDHMEYLGGTLREIAAEKAGILKSGKAVILAHQKSEAREVIMESAEKWGCPVHTLPQESLFMEMEIPAGTFSFYAYGEKWDLGLKGRYQPKNALLALKICEVLEKEGFKISREAKHRGLSKVKWPGRFEILSMAPIWVLDGAHNDDGLKATLDSWESWFGDFPRQIVFGCVAEKDLESMAGQLSRDGTVVHLVRLSTPRSQSMERMTSAFANKEVILNDSPAEALKECRASGQSTLIVGSLYLVGEVLAFLQESPHELKLNG